MSSSEHIPPSPSKSTPKAIPPQNPKGGVKAHKGHFWANELSVFDVLNIFSRRWFLSRADLLANAISAQRAEAGRFSWVEFSPQLYYHLVKCAVALVPHPVLNMTKLIFGCILELLNKEGHKAFFDLQKGASKANNAEKEKRRLARKKEPCFQTGTRMRGGEGCPAPPRSGNSRAVGASLHPERRPGSTSAPKPKWAHHSGRRQQIRCHEPNPGRGRQVTLPNH